MQVQGFYHAWVAMCLEASPGFLRGYACSTNFPLAMWCFTGRWLSMQGKKWKNLSSAFYSSVLSFSWGRGQGTRNPSGDKIREPRGEWGSWYFLKYLILYTWSCPQGTVVGAVSVGTYVSGETTTHHVLICRLMHGRAPSNLLLLLQRQSVSFSEPWVHPPSWPLAVWAQGQLEKAQPLTLDVKMLCEERQKPAWADLPSHRICF